VPLGPEEVEEEGGAEDGGDEDADEDVVGGGADVVVVVDGGAEGVLFDEVLLFEVVWCGDGVSLSVLLRVVVGVRVVDF
jgi:hypothetical protein